MSRNKRFRTIYSVLTSFVIFLCFLMIMEGVNLQVGLLSKQQLFRSATTSLVVEETVQEMGAKMTTEAVQCGLSEREWYEIVGQVDFEKDYHRYLNQAIKKGVVWEKGAEDFNELVQAGMYAYFASNGVTMSDMMQKEVQNTTETMVKLYKRYMQPKWADSFADYVEDMMKSIHIAMLVAIFVGGVLGVVLLLQYHYKHRGMRYICYGMLAATVSHMVLTLILWNSNWVAELDVDSQSYKGMLEGFFHEALQRSVLIGGIALLLCIVMMRLIGMVKRRTK